MSRKVLCLDWDKRTLRMVVARLGGGSFSLEDAHSHRLPSAVDADDPAIMGDFIGQMMKRHRMHHRRAIVDVPRDKAVINRLTLPPTPANEVAAAVRFQAMKELPFPLEEAVIDYVVVRRDANRLVTEVLLAAVRNEALQRLRETCLAAGLTPARIGLRPYANLVSVTHLPEMAERNVLFVDVGPTMTEIDAMCQGRLTFSRSAHVVVPPLSFELTPTDDSRISSKSALMNMERAGTDSESAVTELELEIVRTLQAFRATDPDVVINQVLIAGGTGVENELLAAVEKRLGLPSALYDPTGPLGVKPGEALKLRPFSAALGLAWGLSSEGLLELDFLAPKKPVAARETLARRVRIGAIAAAAVLVVGAAGGVAYYQSLSAQVRALRGEVGKLTEKAQRMRELENRASEAEEWAIEAVWPDHLLRFHDCVPEPGKAMVVRQAKFEDPAAAVTLDVYCRDLATLTQFIERVNDVTLEGEPLYRASQEGAWQEGSTGDPSFNGSAKVVIKLIALEHYKADAKQRERDRKKRLTSF
ncbi:MAG: pilus assembly protein PilM [Phycisphaerae bacterium]